MTKKILLFSRDPGGTNTITPLVIPLEKLGYKTCLFGKDVALDKYARLNLPALDIVKHVKDISISSMIQFLKEEKPDFIITGTSGSDFTERFLWFAGQKLGIQSFAILDQWINYGIRFSNYKISEIEGYNNAKEHVFLPTKILLMDEYAKKEAIRDGLDPSILIPTGQPHFEYITNYANERKQADSDEVRKKYDIDKNDFLITFASEPISADYDSGSKYLGYTEQTIFLYLKKSLEKIASEYDGKITLIVKLHPREDSELYTRMHISNHSEKIRICFDKNSDPLDLIIASDLICGMSSMLLIEAAMLGKTVISVQIGLKKEDPFILSKREILTSVLDENSLYTKLRQSIIDNNPSYYNFSVIENPINNVIHLMEKHLCQF